MINSKLILLQILIWLFFGLTFSKTISSQDSIPVVMEYKNSIKVMAILVPFSSLFIYYPSLGYEKRINSLHAVEVIGTYFFRRDEMGNNTKVFSIRPGYNYYFPKKREVNPVFRIGGYFNFVNMLPNEWGKSGKKYGVGVIAGTRIDISKSHKWYIDLGIGGSVDFVMGKDEWFLDGNGTGWTLTPRPIFHFTRRF